MSITALSAATMLLTSVAPETILVPLPPSVIPIAAPEGQNTAPPQPESPQTPQASDTPAPAPQGTDQLEPGTIIVTAKPPPDPGDPVEAVNEIAFSAAQALDTSFVDPAAKAYKKALPNPLRGGLRQFLNNLQEPVVFLNYMLQLKPGKAAETLGRFTINTTIGAAGLIDVAKKKPFHLPRRPNGFAYTLGYYGVKTGPYLYLPIIGPTTVRDLFGRWVDLLVLPVSVGKPFSDPIYGATTQLVRSLDDRTEADERLRRLRDNSPNHYKALRDDYLKTRQAEIDALRTPKAQPDAASKE